MHLILKKPRDKSFQSFDGYNNVADRVLIVRLLTGSVIDHTVCVDLRHALIYDSVEQYPLQLTQESLFLCAGGEKGKCRVGEVRELANGRMKR